MCQVITEIQLLTYPYSYPRVTRDPWRGSRVSWGKGKGRAGVTLGLPVTYTKDSSDVATEIDDSGDDSPEESAEVELGKCERMSLFQI